MAFDTSIPDASLHKYLIGTTSYPSNFSTDGDLLGATKQPVSITQSEIVSGLARSRSKKLQ
ncbi:hypothetical protein CY34DRAFT_805716 [Suillus luteus UH-Slu-Lm8-n1]|uniref:Uncharacterized protein n=1 Tax=Suillus luteus UH-Slu-Lm8-n1 TaxID=930992 RepID=A0A0D0AV29_9AGAM|nr:hypothetical protein CY34DRAFT_805716 [Suillus luteus UH-Slu-Lm8-n1]